MKRSLRKGSKIIHKQIQIILTLKVPPVQKGPTRGMTKTILFNHILGTSELTLEKIMPTMLKKTTWSGIFNLLKSSYSNTWKICELQACLKCLLFITIH